MAKREERRSPGDASTTGSASQRQVALAIIREGQRLGVSPQGILIALMVGYAESGLKNVNYGDRDSVGVFQQRAAWGPTSARMDVTQSARMFFTGGRGGQRGLLDIRGWEGMDPGRAAQAVQVSAYPDRYNDFKVPAGNLLANLGGGSVDSGFGTNSTGGDTGGGARLPTSSPGSYIPPGSTEREWQPVSPDPTNAPGESNTSDGRLNYSDPLSSAMDKLLATAPGSKSSQGGDGSSGDLVSSPGSEIVGAGDGPVGGFNMVSPASLQSQADMVDIMDWASNTGARTSGLRSVVINNAKKALGTPYVFGGNDMQSGVDCSSLLQLAMKQAGINIPRLAHYQALAGDYKKVSSRSQGTRAMKPGDFIFWGQINKSGDGHIAMYLGNNQIIEAPRSGLTVRVRNLYDSDFTRRPTYAVNMDKYYK